MSHGIDETYDAYRETLRCAAKEHGMHPRMFAPGGPSEGPTSPVAEGETVSVVDYDAVLRLLMTEQGERSKLEKQLRAQAAERHDLRNALGNLVEAMKVSGSQPPTPTASANPHTGSPLSTAFTPEEWAELHQPTSTGEAAGGSLLQDKGPINEVPPVAPAAEGEPAKVGESCGNCARCRAGTLRDQVAAEGLRIGDIVFYRGQRSEVIGTEGREGAIKRACIQPAEFTGWVAADELSKGPK